MFLCAYACMSVRLVDCMVVLLVVCVMTWLNV